MSVANDTTKLLLLREQCPNTHEGHNTRIGGNVDTGHERRSNSGPSELKAVDMIVLLLLLLQYWYHHDIIASGNDSEMKSVVSLTYHRSGGVLSR